MVRINRQSEIERRSANDRSKKRQVQTRQMGCDEALRFLSQVSKRVNVSEDFVTSQELGGGQGASNRDRAVDSAEVQVEEAEKQLAALTKKEADSLRKRAKSNWHLALELVTTGALGDEYAALGVSPKFSTLW